MLWQSEVQLDNNIMPRVTVTLVVNIYHRFWIPQSLPIISCSLLILELLKVQLILWRLSFLNIFIICYVKPIDSVHVHIVFDFVFFLGSI